MTWLESVGNALLTVLKYAAIGIGVLVCVTVVGLAIYWANRGIRMWRRRVRMPAASQRSRVQTPDSDLPTSVKPPNMDPPPPDHRLRNWGWGFAILVGLPLLVFAKGVLVLLAVLLGLAFLVLALLQWAGVFLGKRVTGWILPEEMSIICVERFRKFHRMYISVSSGPRFLHFRDYCRKRNLRYLADHYLQEEGEYNAYGVPGVDSLTLRMVLQDGGSVNAHQIKNDKKYNNGKGLTFEADALKQLIRVEDALLKRFRRQLPFILVPASEKGPIWIGIPFVHTIKRIPEVDEAELKSSLRSTSSLSAAEIPVFIVKESEKDEEHKRLARRLGVKLADEDQLPKLFMPKVPSADGVDTEVSIALTLQSDDPYLSLYNAPSWRKLIINRVVPKAIRAVGSAQWLLMALTSQVGIKDDVIDAIRKKFEGTKEQVTQKISTSFVENMNETQKTGEMKGMSVVSYIRELWGWSMPFYQIEDIDAGKVQTQIEKFAISVFDAQGAKVKSNAEAYGIQRVGEARANATQLMAEAMSGEGGRMAGLALVARETLGNVQKVIVTGGGGVTGAITAEIKTVLDSLGDVPAPLVQPKAKEETPKSTKEGEGKGVAKPKSGEAATGKDSGAGTVMEPEAPPPPTSDEVSNPTEAEPKPAADTDKGGGTA